MPHSATPVHNANHKAASVRIAHKLRELRTNAGLTQAALAKATHVSVTTYRAWESGTSTPRLYRGMELAQALGVPLVALFEPYAVTEVVLSEAAVQAVRREGAPAAERYAQQVAASLPQLILATATPRRSPSRGRAGGRARRSRAEVLAGIAEANRMREARTAPGPPQGQRATSSGGLPSALSQEEGVARLSTLSAEDPDG